MGAEATTEPTPGELIQWRSDVYEVTRVGLPTFPGGDSLVYVRPRGGGPELFVPAGEWSPISQDDEAKLELVTARTRIADLEFDLRRQEEVVQDLRGQGRTQAAVITGLNAEILGLKATLTSAQDRLRESASLVQEFAFGIGERDEQIAQMTDLPSPEMREVAAEGARSGDELWQMTTARDVLASLLRDEMATTLKLASELDLLRKVPGSVSPLSELREVPPSEAIDGDQVTINGYFHGYNANRSTMFVGTKNGATVVEIDVDLMASNPSLNCVTVSRTVPPLHDELGAAIRPNVGPLPKTEDCVYSGDHVLGADGACVSCGASENRQEIPFEARKRGDLVSITGRYCPDDDAEIYADPPGSGHGPDRGDPIGLTEVIYTVTRAVSPLPDKPGAVGTATIRGDEKNVQVHRIPVHSDPDRPWVCFLGGVQSRHRDSDLSDYQPLLDGQEGDR